MPTSQTGDQVSWGRASMRRDDFVDFYRAELLPLLALAHAVCEPSVADDAAQDTMLAAYRGWKRVRETPRPDAWVRRRCAHVAASGLRTRWVTLLWSSSALSRHGDPPLDVDERTAAVWQDVRRLPGRTASCLALHHVLGLRAADVAGTLGLSAESAEEQIGRGHAVVDEQRLVEAAAALNRSVRGVDVDVRLDDLVDTRRRRLAARVAGLLAVVALVVAAWALLGGAPQAEDDDPQPGPLDPPGARALVTNLSGSDNEGRIRVEDSGGHVETITSLPDGTGLVNPDDLEVSPEGDRLALVGGDTLQILGLGDDPTSVSVPCPRCLFVDWMGFKVGILLVTSYDADGAHTSVYGDNGVERGGLTLAEGIAPPGYSPDRLHMVGVQELGRGADRRSRLFVLDDGTGVRTPLPRTETEPGRFIYDVAWSPDGVLVGYVEAGDYTGGGVAAQDYRLMVASADGSSAHEVADLGRCYCVRLADPRFAWSPDGSTLLAATVTSKDSADSNEVRVFDIDGNVRRTLPGGAPVDWGPNPP